VLCAERIGGFCSAKFPRQFQHTVVGSRRYDEQQRTSNFQTDEAHDQNFHNSAVRIRTSLHDEDSAKDVSLLTSRPETFAYLAATLNQPRRRRDNRM